jgi:hypothetical protein
MKTKRGHTNLNPPTLKSPPLKPSLNITPTNNKSPSRFSLNPFPPQKRAQLTIFIILTILLIAIIAIVLYNQGTFTNIFQTQSPIEQIAECSQNHLQQAITLLSNQGGAIQPENYFLYQDNKVDYICYTNEDYKPCKMQKPILKTSIEQELEKYTTPKIKQCIESTKTTLLKKGKSITNKEPEISIELMPNNAIINIELDLQITDSESRESYKTIKTDVNTMLYDFIAITSQISNNEVEFGDTETINYMLTNQPWLQLEKKKQSEGTKIYILTDRESKDNFIFATRSYAIPPAGIN